MTAPSPLVADLVARLSPELYADWEERAAIIEFDAGFAREDAEAFALLDVLGRHPGALLGGVIVKGTRDGIDRYVVSIDEEAARAWLDSKGATSIGTVEFSYAIDDLLGGLAELVPVQTAARG
jgi:hypothetical protein